MAANIESADKSAGYNDPLDIKSENESENDKDHDEEYENGMFNENKMKVILKTDDEEEKETTEKPKRRARRKVTENISLREEDSGEEIGNEDPEFNLSDDESLNSRKRKSRTTNSNRGKMKKMSQDNSEESSNDKITEYRKKIKNLQRQVSLKTQQVNNLKKKVKSLEKDATTKETASTQKSVIDEIFANYKFNCSCFRKRPTKKSNENSNNVSNDNAHNEDSKDFNNENSS